MIYDGTCKASIVGLTFIEVSYESLAEIGFGLGKLRDDTVTRDIIALFSIGFLCAALIAFQLTLKMHNRQISRKTRAGF